LSTGDPTPSEPPPPDLRVDQKLSYAVPNFAMAAGGALFGQWLTYFYLPPDAEIAKGRAALVSAGLFAALMLAGRVVDALADPLIGYWSDRTRSRMGRRLPFMLVATPFLALFFGMMWFPPFEPGSTGNAVYLAVSLFGYWFFFTAVVAPYLALLPEIAVTTHSRVNLSSYMAIFTMLGTVVASILIGYWQSAYPEGVDLFGVHIGSGIQLFAIVAIIATLFLFWAPLLNIRETPHSAKKEVPAGLFKGTLSTFKNKAFLTYLGIACLFQMGLVMVVTALPYLCTQILERLPGEDGIVGPGEGEAWAGYLMAILVVLAVIWVPFVNKIVARVGKKRLMVGSGLVFGAAISSIAAVPLLPDPAVGMIAAIVVMSFPAACGFVLPYAIAADVVDHDELTTGVRREGIYTGATAVITKGALGLASAAVVGLLTFGNSREDPLGLILIGPVSAFFVLLGTWVFSKHPIDE
jgi:glycoside/pentoside/hexuronide:cation symporter, GPH family